MISVTRAGKEHGLDLKEWRFYADVEPGGTLVIRLSEYIEYHRESKRKGWRPTKAYHAVEKRYSTIQFESVPTPQDVADEALATLVKSLVFKWDWR